MDQHSKFLFLDSEAINGFTTNEGVSRLRFFFPKADHRFISTFSPIEIREKEGVTVLPPIIRKLAKNKTDRSKIVVYFSPYTDDRKQFERVLDMLTEQGDYHFVIYSDLEFSGYQQVDYCYLKLDADSFSVGLTGLYDDLLAGQGPASLPLPGEVS